MIGIDADGADHIVNPSTEALLGTAPATSARAPIETVLPEIAPLVEEAQHSPASGCCSSRS